MGDVAQAAFWPSGVSARTSASCLSISVAHLGDDRVEGLGIVDRQLGEALAVEADLGESKPMNQPAVAQAAHLGGRGRAG